MYRISDMIIALHNLAREVEVNHFDEGYKIRMLANELAKIGNKINERESDDTSN